MLVESAKFAHWALGGSWSGRVAYVRAVKTSSGVTAVQIVWSCWLASWNIEHIGSAHGDGEFEALRAAQRRLAAGQVELDLDTLRRVDARLAGAPPPVHLTD